jgi:hypothetical protein
VKRVHQVFEFTRSMQYPTDGLDMVVIRRLSSYQEEELFALIAGCEELINLAREACNAGDEENDL